MRDLLKKFIGAWAHPWATLRGLSNDGSAIRGDVVFVLVMGVLSGLVAVVLRAPAGMALVMVPAGLVLGSFVVAAVLWLVVKFLLAGQAADFRLSYKLVALLTAFSPLGVVLSFFPRIAWTGVVLNAWETMVLVGGMILVLKANPIRTGALACLVFAAIVVFVLFSAVVGERTPLAPLSPALAAPQNN